MCSSDLTSRFVCGVVVGIMPCCTVQYCISSTDLRKSEKGVYDVRDGILRVAFNIAISTEDTVQYVTVYAIVSDRSIIVMKCTEDIG